MLFFLHTSLTINPSSANITKWSNTLKQFVGSLPTNCLSMFDNFVGLALKGLKRVQIGKEWIFQKTFVRKGVIFSNIKEEYKVSCVKASLFS